MEKSEQKFTQDDIKKIKSKRSKSNIAFFIAFIVLGTIIFFMESSTPIMLKGMAYFFFAITGYVVFDMFFGDNSKKDLQNQIKVVTKVTVTDKSIKHRGGGKNRVSYYELSFDGNGDIEKYEVKKDIYNKVQIGDVIDIEYSKSSLWILKIELNSENIENRGYVK